MNHTSDREKRHAQPNVRVELPALSPAFVSADDAARYAHRLIGDFRNVEYGGAILKDAQGRYYATRPVRDQSGSFNPTRVISTDAQGLFITPAGYTCYALYHSHPSNYEELQRAFKHWSTEEIQTAISFFSSNDIVLNMLNAYFAVAHYLSCPNGALLKYVSSGSAVERALSERIAYDVHAKKLSFSRIAEYVQEVARAGTLSIIQSNEVWGGKLGQVTTDFKVFTPHPLLDIAPVMVSQPAFSSISSTLEQALKEARARVYQTAESQYGVILKFKNHPFYISTEPVSEEMDFSLARIFGRNTAGRALVPANFEIVGLYACDGFYRDPSEVPAQEPTVFKNFLHPDALAKGIEVAKRLKLPAASQAVPLFIVCRDGALLKYVSTFAAAEEKFLRALPQSEGGALAVLRDLLGGVYTPSNYIRDLAAAGQLSVLHTSDLWRYAGRVAANWQPYKDFYRRELGPSFVSADDAARYAHNVIAKRTDYTYGGIIYQRLDNRFVATEPMAVKNETFDATLVFPPELMRHVPHGFSVVAVYHTHCVHPLQLWRSADEEQLFRNMLEPHELYDAIKNSDWASARYFSTQNGTLLRYTPSGSAKEVILLSQISPPRLNPEKVRRNTLGAAMRANSIKPGQYVAQVAEAGDLYVVVGSALWGKPGKITPTWKPGGRTSAVTQALSPPALSPIFAQSEDAVRYAHEHMGARTTAQYGVILRSTHSEEYVTTLPLEGGDFSMERLYPRDDSTQPYTLPMAFQLHGVYVGAPEKVAPIKGHLTNRRVYDAFISPVDLFKALQLAISLKHEDALVGEGSVIYISGGDGALLRFFSTLDAVQLSTGLFKDSGQALLNDLTALRLTPLEYVRQVAMAGELHVLQTNAVWHEPGSVSGGWQPYGLESAPRPASTLKFFPASPVFCHPDDAARFVHRRIKLPHTVNIMGGVLYEATYESYVALEPVVNGESVNVAEMISKTHGQPTASARAVLPRGYSLVSLHYSRDVRGLSAESEVEAQLIRNLPWPEDLCYAFHTEEVIGIVYDYVYVSADDGGLLRYGRGNEAATFALCNGVSGYGWTTQAYFVENAQPLPIPTPASEILTKLLNSGSLRVLVSSASWPLQGGIQSRHTISTEPSDLDYEGTTAAQPIANVKVGPLRDEL